MREAGTAYNYAHFDRYVEHGGEVAEFAAFPDHLHVGQPAPAAELTRLDGGGTVDLADLWRRQPLVMEFGSFT